MDLFQGFLNPTLAAGALLAGVPLLIHLLNRQRHKPLDWAAMRFVEAAFRRTRRRSQLENLILLLLRMAAVALLGLAVARPFLGEESLLAPLTESRRDVVMILDGSASTGYRESISSVFDRILERSRERIEALDGASGDRVTLIVGSSAARTLSDRTPEAALAALGTVTKPSSEPMDLAAVFGEVLQLAETESAGTETSGLEVVLLTDLQKRSFQVRAASDAEDALETPALVRALDRLEELGVSIKVEDLGPSQTTPPNLGVESVAPIDTVLGPGLATEVEVTVKNWGTKTVPDARVSLWVDGVKLPTRKLSVPARSSASVLFPFEPRRTGEHVLEARLPGDRLTFDDSAATILDVPPPVDVLLVDGDPADRLDKTEVGFLGAVLEAPPDDNLGRAQYKPFEVRTQSLSAFTSSDPDLDEVDVLVLANVATLPGSTVTAIEERVAKGGAVVFTLGDSIEGARGLKAFNDRFFDATGTGLAPAELVRQFEVPERRANFHRCADFDVDHPALKFFADERWSAYLTEVPVYGFVATAPLENARVLARLDDAANSPLLIERAYARGKTYLWTTSIDGDWTNLPELPTSFVPLTHEWFRHAGRPAPRPTHAVLGAPLSAEFEQFPRNASLSRPDGSKTRIDATPEELVGGRFGLEVATQLDQLGVWTVSAENTPDLAFVVEGDATEGDLERLAPNELSKFHSALELESLDADDSQPIEDDASRGELWRWLAGLALLALIGETLWSAWIGWKRRIA